MKKFNWTIWLLSALLVALSAGTLLAEHPTEHPTEHPSEHPTEHPQGGQVSKDDFYPVPMGAAFAEMVSLITGQPKLAFSAHPGCGVGCYIFKGDDGKFCLNGGNYGGVSHVGSAGRQAHKYIRRRQTISHLFIRGKPRPSHPLSQPQLFCELLTAAVVTLGPRERPPDNQPVYVQLLCS